jgi:nucleoside-diphosphate-sugar epimerase
MKILLAGGAGYIGSQLAPALRDHGYTVEVIDLCWFGNKLPPDIKVIRKDLFDCTLEDLKDYDQLIFLAGLSNDPMAEYSPARNFISNAALPAYLAFIAKQAGISRYIYASSCSVYGYTVNKMYDETDTVSCAYPYGISKLQGESGVFQLNDDSFSVISLRQGTVSGHSRRMRMDLIVNTMFKTAMTEGKVVINNPAIWRPIFDLRDTVTAFLRAVQADHTISGVFNVASGNFTVGQVGDIVKNEVEQLTGEKIDIDLRNIQDFRNYKVSIEKAKTYLGYQPQYDIKETIDNLFENKDSYGDFDRDEFYNIRVFKKL